MVRFILTKYEPVPGHGDPIRALPMFFVLFADRTQTRNHTKTHVFKFYMDPGGPGALGKVFWKWYASF